MSNTLGFGLDVNRGGAGYKYQSETVTLLRALTGTYSTPRKIEIDKLIKSLKTAGIWSKLDVIQMYAAPTAADAVVNWKSPGTFNATLVNSPTLEADRGITGDGASSYVNTGYDPDIAPLYDLNSALIGCYSRTDNTQALLGSSTATVGNTRIEPYTGSAVGYRLNCLSASISTPAKSLGLSVINRSASDLVTHYKNGAADGTDTTASTSENTASIAAGKSAAAFMVHQYSVFLGGASLDATQHLALYTAIETYLDYIGAGVIT